MNRMPLKWKLVVIRAVGLANVIVLWRMLCFTGVRDCVVNVWILWVANVV